MHILSIVRLRVSHNIIILSWHLPGQLPQGCEVLELSGRIPHIRWNIIVVTIIFSKPPTNKTTFKNNHSVLHSDSTFIRHTLFILQSFKRLVHEGMFMKGSVDDRRQTGNHCWYIQYEIQSSPHHSASYHNNILTQHNQGKKQDFVWSLSFFISNLLYSMSG